MSRPDDVSRSWGCHRRRPESPQDQLDTLHALGDAAQDQRHD